MGPSGNLYIADGDNHRIRKVDSSGIISTVAGSGPGIFSGDSGPASLAILSSPSAVFLDDSGNLYIADMGHSRIRKVDPFGTITTIAGNGTHGFSGDGDLATEASLSGPSAISVDDAGNLYISDMGNHRIRKVDMFGTITTIAGNGRADYWGDGGPAIRSSLSSPTGIFLDSSDNLYIADRDNHRIRKVDPSKTITTVAGIGNADYLGDGGPATNASLFYPNDIFVDQSGALYIADSGNHRVRHVENTFRHSDFNGDGTVDFSDFLEFAKHFGTQQGEKDFEIRFDLTYDGEVGFGDFLAFLGTFGNQTISIDLESTTSAPPLFLSPINVGDSGDNISQSQISITTSLPGNVTMDFVWIDSGEFLMGSPNSEPGRESHEGPKHKVTISRGFHLGKFEVTQMQWQAVMKNKPWINQSFVQDNPNHPVVSVSWNDIQEFVQNLNEASTENFYRLPTEAEWEYACRAGSNGRFFFDEGEFLLPEYVWYRDTAWNVGERYGHPVGTKKPNDWGLYDIHGNVWEWVYDIYSSNYYSVSPEKDPSGPQKGTTRIFRGGAFYSQPYELRSAFRCIARPTLRDYRVGFRLLRIPQ